MKRTIYGYLQPEKINDGLPALPELPEADGRMPCIFIHKKIYVDGWSSESVVSIAKTYGRMCAVAADLEIAALTAERDTLKAELDELRAAESR